MRVLVTNELRLVETPDGAVWAPGEGSSFYSRYLDVFDEVTLLARVRPTTTVPDDWERVDHEGVQVVRVPYYQGVSQYVRARSAVLRVVRDAIRPGDAAVVRTGNIGGILIGQLARERRPFGLEVLGDPYDVFAPGAVRHVLRPVLRWWTPRELRRWCRMAAGVAYVTESTLQRRYPPARDAYATHYSSISLPPEDLVPMPRGPEHFRKASFTLSFAGSFEQMYKAPDVLLEALALGVRRGLDLRLLMMGDGRHRDQIETMVHRLGLKTRVKMLGYLATKQEVQQTMDQSDLFVLPSRTEGLPRVIIEAMARALPCVGTRVGGIPELLPTECLVPKDDAPALATAITALLSNPARAAALSARNLCEAKKYRDDVLTQRRRRFYRHIRSTTEQWLEQRHGDGRCACFN